MEKYFLYIIDDATKFHIIRSAPDLISPEIGKLPSGSLINSDCDRINMYGWWLRLSSSQLSTLQIKETEGWVMGQAPDQPVYFEREIALKYESLLPNTDIHAVYEEPVLDESTIQIGKIKGGSNILGVSVVDNKDGKWLLVYANQFDSENEGWTLISDINGKVYFHLVEPGNTNNNQ